MTIAELENVCKLVNRQYNAFGGNCGMFALAMQQALTKLQMFSTVDIILCTDYEHTFSTQKEQEETPLEEYLEYGDPNIYHVCFYVDKKFILDGHGITTIKRLEDFCYKEYRDRYPTITAFSINNTEDYVFLETTIRNNTNWSTDVEEFYTTIMNEFLKMLP